MLHSARCSGTQCAYRFLGLIVITLDSQKTESNPQIVKTRNPPGLVQRVHAEPQRMTKYIVQNAQSK